MIECIYTTHLQGDVMTHDQELLKIRNELMLTTLNNAADISDELLMQSFFKTLLITNRGSIDVLEMIRGSDPALSLKIETIIEKMI